MDILEEIVAHKRVEIDERKRYVPIQQFIGDVKKQIEAGKPASMRAALMSSKTASSRSLSVRVLPKAGSTKMSSPRMSLRFMSATGPRH